ncbi:transmembrane protein 45B-like [Diadema antillarum]|uniref:transmembrane protein 45B-like n=1 Tax=Diadema antillarum TaxID=105358 RepID=UPI003A8772CE
MVRDAFSTIAVRERRRSPNHSRTGCPDTRDQRELHHGQTYLALSEENGSWESFDFESAEDETTLYSRDPAKHFALSQKSSADDLDEQHEDPAERADDQDSAGEDKRNSFRDISVNHARNCMKLRDIYTNVTVIEGVLKIMCAVIGALGELWWGGWYMFSPRTGEFTNANNWQHATMFMFFAVSGVADITLQTCVRQNSTLNCEKIFLSLAFWIEALLFHFHTGGRDDLDVHIHSLLVGAILLCAIGSGLEPWCYHPSFPSVRRLWVGATTLQGTWFWQIAFVLYNPWQDKNSPSPWKPAGTESIMMLTTMFAWHLLYVLVIFLIIKLIIRRCSELNCCRYS